MVFDFFSQTLDMYIHGTGITDIFIAPDLIQKLFPGKNMIGRGSEEIKKLQLLGRHFHGFSHVDDGIVGLVDGEIRVFHTLDACGSAAAGAAL